MQIKFIPLETSEVKREKIYYDLGAIEYFINDRLKGENFKDVQQLSISIHTYIFDGVFSPFFQPLSKKKGYKPKDQCLSITVDVDYSKMATLNEESQYEAITSTICEAIEKAKKLQGRVKRFDFNKFHSKVIEGVNDWLAADKT